jgi:hypothetical protein
MQKAILVSILALTIIVPTINARRWRNPRLALQRTVFWMLVGICFYATFVLFVWPRVLS